MSVKDITPNSALIFLFIVATRISAEEKGNAPYPCKSNYGVDNSADNSSATAKSPCNKVKTEKSYKSPVKCTDNNEN